MIDWRAALDSLRIEWRDRGRNTSADNVNICCPWCGPDDSSFHMAIAETRDAYYCFRRPQQHSGTNTIRLIMALGAGSRIEAARLLHEHSTEARALPPPEARRSPYRWSNFLPAYRAPIFTEYLARRKFADPEDTARRFDLRLAPDGAWARRLLLPCLWDDEVIGWTGRAIDRGREPRYLSQIPNIDGAIYLPAAPMRIMIVVEGPLDALKLAAAGRRDGFSAVGVLGKNFNDSRLWRLATVLQDCDLVIVALDADTSITDATRTMQSLRPALLRCRGKGVIQRASLPRGVKDAGDLTEHEARTWLRPYLPSR